MHPLLRIVERTDLEIRRLLSKAASAAESDLVRLSPGNVVRRGQMSGALQALRGTLGLLFADVGDTVKAGRTDAAQAAREASFDWVEPLLREAGLSTAERDMLRAGAIATTERNVDLMLRRYNSEQLALSKQVYKTKQLSQGWVDRVINTSIGRGLTAREIAREVRSSIRPNTAGGVAHAALRLGRTELNNSFHTAAIVANADKPWAEAMEWHLSGSHARKDICDEYAGKDSWGLGDGIFPKNKVPDKPHPNCFCFIVPKLQDEDDFVASFIRGDYDDVINITPAPVAPVLPKAKEGRAALGAVPRALWDSDLESFEERSIFQSYKSFAYVNYNKYLRDGSGAFYRDEIETMDRILDSSPLKEDATFWRGIKAPRNVMGDLVDGDLTGMEWQEDAFSSLSADRRVADAFAEDGMVMRVLVRKGAPMLQLSEWAKEGQSTQVYEAEGLGGRGWKFRVISDNGIDDKGVRNVDVEVINSGRNGTDPWVRS